MGQLRDGPALTERVDELIMSRGRKFISGAKRILITIPSLSPGHLSLDFTMVRINQKIGRKLEWFIGCMEKHEDGTPHFHFVFVFKSPYTTRNARCFDWIARKHGDYKVLKGPLWKAVAYVMKDKNFIVLPRTFDIQLFLTQAKAKKSTAMIVGMTKMYTDPLCSVRDVCREVCPLKAARNLRMMKAWKAQTMIWHGVDAIKEYVPFAAPLMMIKPLNVTTLMQWCNRNFSGFPKDRPVTSKGLWISGSPGLGKTRAVFYLIQKKFMECYHVPDEDFDCLYENGVYRFALFDDFHGQKTRGYMLKFCGGYPTPLLKKGGDPVMKENLPVIVTCHKTIAEQYADTHRFPNMVAALSRRFVEVHFTEPFTLE